ncbi:MAG TPA: hypothetical protein VGM82_24455 [Gemmatimonadaceae bacterium]
MTMHITIVGDGHLVGPLAELSTRAGHTVLQVDGQTIDPSACALSELVIVAGDRVAVSDTVAIVATRIRDDAVVVDATTTLEVDQSDGSEEHIDASEWMSLLPTTRIVRAFASVPADAFVALTDQSKTHDPTDLAVPLAGDDADSKSVVQRFMQQIGVDPFDLGPLTVSYVMEPGGPLWGKAADALEMQECIGWLAGDG